MRMYRSPIFWGALGVVAVGVGAAFVHKRHQLRGGMGRGSAGPMPKLITRNPAEMPTPTQVIRSNGRVLTRYEARDISIDERLKLIQQGIWDDVNNPRIRQLALEITQHCGRDDGACEAQAVFDAVKKRVRYTGDVGPVLNPATGKVEGIDFYQRAPVTWDYRGGDCDDFVRLISSLLASIGHTMRLRVTAPSRFDDWAHIYAVSLLPKDRPSKAVAVDPTLPWSNARIGSEAKYGKARDYVMERPA